MVLDDIAAGPEERLRRDDMVAGFQRRHHRRGHRRHAGRGRAARSGTFERGHPRLQHRDRRIGEAGILEARILVEEARLGLLGAVVDMPLR